MILLSRLPRPVRAPLAAVGLIAALQTAPMLAPADAPLAPVAAQAAITTRVCNSADSTDLHRILVWQIGGGGWYVYHGTCGPGAANGSDQLRADTCPDNNVFDYYQQKAGSGYGQKHYGCNTGVNIADYAGNVYLKMTN